MGGGGGGGGGECQRIKVLRSRVYPLGQLPTFNAYLRDNICSSKGNFINITIHGVLGLVHKIS